MNATTKGLLAAAALLLAGCNDNARARALGSKITVRLEPGRKLQNATWKEESLWILTRPARPGEEPETLHFDEKSNWGVVEGRVEIVEVAR